MVLAENFNNMIIRQNHEKYPLTVNLSALLNARLADHVQWLGPEVMNAH
jgi:hypothetical protein